MSVDLRAQAKEQIAAQIAEGVRHFPVPSRVEHTGDADVASVQPNYFAEKIQNCVACPLAKTRQRVVAKDMSSPRRYLALAEFPDIADEQSETFFPEGAPSHLLSRLFDKLGISKDIQPAFAIKCVPRSGVSDGSARACGAHFAWELDQLKPEAVLLFGHRARFAYQAATGEHLTGVVEMGRVETRSSLVFILPSVVELAAYPEWRSAVWRLLQPLRAEI